MLGFTAFSANLHGARFAQCFALMSAARPQVKMRMLWNPLHDPFVETGYFGYTVRAIAQRQGDGTFVPLLEVTGASGISGAADKRLYFRKFREAHSNPDLAMQYALGHGRRVVDALIEDMWLDDEAEKRVGKG